MELIENKQFDEERALYGSRGVRVVGCSFDGPADGESALKESADIEVEGCYCNLRYPFWHDTVLSIANTEMTELCRAALWYSREIDITASKLHGIKALRECADVKITDCDIISPEFGWSVDGFEMQRSTITGEYVLMRSRALRFTEVTLHGKYSFQYIEDATFDRCHFDTKDAFWHAKNVTVRDSVVRGEYLAWYSDRLTLINCKIIGTQPFCYCTNLTLIDCEMIDADLAFEKSEVQASITTPVISIKNPYSGRITVPAVDEIICTDPDSRCEIVVTGN